MSSIYKKYTNIIVIGLLFLFCCKSCQSCHRANQIEWNKIQYEQKIDSIDSILNLYKLENNTLRDSIILYKELNNTIIDNYELLKKNNKVLISSNKQIIKLL